MRIKNLRIVLSENKLIKIKTPPCYILNLKCEICGD